MEAVIQVNAPTQCRIANMGSVAKRNHYTHRATSHARVRVCVRGSLSAAFVLSFVRCWQFPSCCSVSFVRTPLVRKSHFATLYYILMWHLFVCGFVACRSFHSAARSVPSRQAIFCHFALICSSSGVIFFHQHFSVQLISA